MPRFRCNEGLPGSRANETKCNTMTVSLLNPNLEWVARRHGAAPPRCRASGRAQAGKVSDSRHAEGERLLVDRECPSMLEGVDADRDDRMRRPVQSNVMSAETLTAILDLIADGVAVVNSTGRVVYANTPLCELFGLTRDDLIDRPIEKLVPDAARRGHELRRAFYTQPLHRTSEAGNTPLAAALPREMGRSDVDIEGLHSDGSRIPIDVRLAELPHTKHIVATVRDMTAERHKAAGEAIRQHDLKAANQRNMQLTATHDRVLQHLFAVATHVKVHADRDSGSSDRLEAEIDDVMSMIRADTFPEGATRDPVIPSATPRVPPPLGPVSS